MNADVQYGDLSAVFLQNSPFWGHWIRTPELHIALLDEWENKIEQLAETTIQENVTSISGVPTWTLVLMKRILEIYRQKKYPGSVAFPGIIYSWRCFVYSLP